MQIKRILQIILVEDNKIRKFLKKKLYTAGISKIEIERAAKELKLIFTLLNQEWLLVEVEQALKH